MFGPNPSEGRFASGQLKLIDRNGTQVGTLGVARVGALGLDKRPLTWLGVNHTGANLVSFTGRFQLSPWTYATWGVCHQAVNVAVLESGFRATLLSMHQGGWTTFLSTTAYGSYGGQLYRDIFTGLEARRRSSGE